MPLNEKQKQKIKAPPLTRNPTVETHLTTAAYVLSSI